MRGIKDRVAIIGMGCTKFGERWDASAADLMVEAAYEAFDDAGMAEMLQEFSLPLVEHISLALHDAIVGNRLGCRK